MDPTPEQKALLEFKQISNILAVPIQGSPLLDKRRWRLPCPDKQAFADYPESEKKRNDWLKEWNYCPELITEPQQANQSSEAT